MKVGGRLFGGLSLASQLLLPGAAVGLMLAVSGAYVTSRDLSAQARANADRALSRSALNADAFFRDATSYLIESVTGEVNTEGTSQALRTRDVGMLQQHLVGRLSLRARLNLAVVTDDRGVGLVEARRQNGQPMVASGTRWAGTPFVDDVLRGTVDAAGDERVGFVGLDGRLLLAVAGPVRAERVLGSVIVGIDLRTLVDEAAARSGARVALYGSSRTLLADSSPAGVSRTPEFPSSKGLRLPERIGGRSVYTLYEPLTLRDDPIGAIAVSSPRSSVLGPIRSYELRWMLILVVALAALLGAGYAVSRAVLHQLRSLRAAMRATRHGDLSARAQIHSTNELGELALGYNAMAEALETSYAELERRVALRTDELRHLYDEQVRVSESRSQLVAALTHDFRNELFAMDAVADMMTDPALRPAHDDWPNELGKVIRQASRGMLDRVNEVLDRARLEASGTDLDLHDVDVANELDALRPTVAALVRTGGLKLSLDVPPALPLVRADPRQLRVIVLNLVSNAVKYTSTGGRVGLKACLRDRTVEISVSDDGIGIPADESGHVFEPFYRVRHERARRGKASTGLGLALTKRLVEAHHGQIGFTSEEGAGTTFTFSLPLVADMVVS